MKIKLNDNVVVIAGKDRGKTGKVIKVDSKNDRVTVEKLNIRTKHIKKTSQGPGQKVQFEAPIHVSNVMLVCPQTNKRTRVGYKKLEDGKKIRVSKKSNEALDTKVAAKSKK